jgi:hypothetical protein
MLGAQGLWAGRDLYRATYCDTGPRFIWSHPKDRHPRPTVGFEPPTQGSSDHCARRSNHCTTQAVVVNKYIVFFVILYPVLSVSVAWFNTFITPGVHSMDQCFILMPGPLRGNITTLYRTKYSWAFRSTFSRGISWRTWLDLKKKIIAI